ncbi:MAG: hypothetical protein ACKN9T_14300 [Candidatus Methylumidiphilus sp.]
MKSRKRLGLMDAVALLAASAAAPAATLTIQIDGVAFTGLGSCDKAPSGCTDLANLPPGGDVNGPFDQVELFAYSTSVSSTITGTINLGQNYVFVPGDTGAGSTAFLAPFNLNRNVTLSLSVPNPAYPPLVQQLIQDGTLLVGLYEDTMTINTSSLLSFDLTQLGLTGTLRMRMGLTSVTAGIDPEGTVPSTITLNEIPAPPTLALLATGLLGMAVSGRLKP